MPRPAGPPPAAPPAGPLPPGPLPTAPLLAGRVVLVSGVGPDLGRAIALRSAEAGADVVLAARTASRLDEVAKGDGARPRRGGDPRRHHGRRFGRPPG